MIVRQIDGRLVLCPYREKVNMDVSDVVSVEMTRTGTRGLDRDCPRARAIVIRSKDAEGEDTAVVIVLEAKTTEALEIKQGL